MQQLSTQEKIKLLLNETRKELENDFLIKKDLNRLEDESFYPAVRKFLIEGDFIRFIRCVAVSLFRSNTFYRNSEFDFDSFGFEDEHLKVLFLLLKKYKDNAACYFLYMEDESYANVRMTINLAENFLKAKKIDDYSVMPELRSKFEKQFEKNYFSEIFNIVNEDISALMILSENEKIDFTHCHKAEHNLFFYITPLSLLHLKTRINVFEVYAAANIADKKVLAKHVNIFQELIIWKESVMKSAMTNNNPVLDRALFLVEGVYGQQWGSASGASIFGCLRFQSEEIERLKKFFKVTNEAETNFSAILGQYKKGGLQNRKATFEFISNLQEYEKSFFDDSYQGHGQFSEFLLILHNVALGLADQLDRAKIKIKGNKHKFARFFLEACRKAFGLDAQNIMGLDNQQLSSQLRWIARLLQLQAFLLDPLQLKSFKIVGVFEIIGFTIDSEANVKSKNEKRKAAYDIVLALVRAKTSEDYVQLFATINVRLPMFRQLGKSKRSMQLEDIVLQLRDALIEKIINGELDYQGIKFSLEQLLEIFANIANENEVSLKSGELVRYIIQQAPAEEQIYFLHDALIKNIFNPLTERNGRKINVEEYIGIRSNIIVKAIAELYLMHRASKIPVPPALHLFAALLNYTVSEFMLKNQNINYKLSIINARYIHLSKVTSRDIKRNHKDFYNQIMAKQAIQNVSPNQDLSDEPIEMAFDGEKFSVAEENQLNLRVLKIPEKILAHSMLVEQAFASIKAHDHMAFLRRLSIFLLGLAENINQTSNEINETLLNEIISQFEEVLFYSRVDAESLNMLIDIYHFVFLQKSVFATDGNLFLMLYKKLVAVLYPIISFREYSSYLPTSKMVEVGFNDYLDYKEKIKHSFDQVIQKQLDKIVNLSDSVRELSYQGCIHGFDFLIEDLESLAVFDAEESQMPKMALPNKDILSVRFFYLTGYVVNYLVLHFDQFQDVVKHCKSKKFSDQFYLEGIVLLLEKMDLKEMKDILIKNSMTYVEEGRYQSMLTTILNRGRFLSGLSSADNDSNAEKIKFLQGFIKKIQEVDLSGKQKVYKCLLALQLILRCESKLESKAFFAKSTLKIALIRSVMELSGVLNVASVPRSTKSIEKELLPVLRQLTHDARFIGGIHWFKDEKRLEALEPFVLLLFKAEDNKNMQDICRKSFKLIMNILFVEDGRYEEVFKSTIKDTDVMEKFASEIMTLRQSLSMIELSCQNSSKSDVAQSMGQLMQAMNQDANRPVNDNCSLHT